MPLFRLGGEKVIRKDLGLDYTVPEMFAGSILDLEPDTEYEARFQMRDPDGVSGEAVHTVKVRTRGEPKAAPDGRVLHVYPPGWKGPKQEPAFTGLKQAYFGSGNGDWAVRQRAEGARGRHHSGARRAVQRRPVPILASARSRFRWNLRI